VAHDTTPGNAATPSSRLSSFALPSFRFDATLASRQAPDASPLFATPAGRDDGDDDDDDVEAEAAAEAYLAQSTPRASSAVAATETVSPAGLLALSPAAEQDTSALAWTPPAASAQQGPATPQSSYALPLLPPSRRLPSPFVPPPMSPLPAPQLPPPRSTHRAAVQRRVE
jgi:hypothetical protein